MKLKNVSAVEQKVLPNDGSASFACQPGAESPELSDVCAEQLAASLPAIWAPMKNTKPKKEK